jgi:hypothetical protein
VATKTIPESTKTSLGQRLRGQARQRWPTLAGVQARFRGRFAYVDGELSSGDVLPQCRLRYAGSASLWGFAIYLAASTAIRARCCQAACRSARPRRPWTAPADSTWPTPAPGGSTCHQPTPDHARTSIRQHQDRPMTDPVTVTPQDVRQTASVCRRALQPVADMDWDSPAGDLQWSCRTTLGHVLAAVLYYASI